MERVEMDARAGGKFVIVESATDAAEHLGTYESSSARAGWFSATHQP